jgi:hypothetical protein
VNPRCLSYDTVGKVIVTARVYYLVRGTGYAQRFVTCGLVGDREGAARSQNTRVFQRVLQYRLFDGSEDESDVRGVGGLSEAAECQHVEYSRDRKSY